MRKYLRDLVFTYRFFIVTSEHTHSHPWVIFGQATLCIDSAVDDGMGFSPSSWIVLCTHRATASPNTRREWLINFYQKRISLHTLYLLFPGPRTGPRTHPCPPPQIDIQVNYYYESAARFHATQSGVYRGMKYNNQTRRKNTKTHPLGNYTRILTKYEYFVQRKGITGLLCVLFTICICLMPMIQQSVMEYT